MKTRLRDTRLVPRIWRSRAGRLTVIIPLPHGAIKVYQAANSTHADFLTHVLARPELAGKFHTLLFTWKKLVAAEWVEGSSLRSSSGLDPYPVLDWIAAFHAALHGLPLQVSDGYVGFDYMQYLRLRLLRYAPANLDSGQLWELLTAASASPLECSKLSHPDVTFRNIVREQSTGSLKLVDNELITQSPFYLLDLYNTCYSLYPSSELMAYYLRQYSDSLADLSLRPGWHRSLSAAWAMRLIGTQFQAGQVTEGLKRLNEWEAVDDMIGTQIVRSLASHSGGSEK